MGEHTPTQACTRSLIRAGLIDDSGRPIVTLHGLRRTCGSLSPEGFSLIAVSRFLGHADPHVTARVSAHLLDDEQLAALPAAFEDLERHCPRHARNIRTYLRRLGAFP